MKGGREVSDGEEEERWRLVEERWRLVEGDEISDGDSTVAVHGGVIEINFYPVKWS